MKNTQLIYSKKPDETFLENTSSFFEIKQTLLSPQTLKDGDYLVFVQYVSIDPVMRVWLSGAETYFPALKPGDVMHCFGVGVIILSKNENFEVGQKVMGNLGIQNYSIVSKERRKSISIIPSIDQSISIKNYLTLINNGMAAYMGLIEVCDPKPKETVLVSTAAGATGLFVCQLAKQRGCKVIGITGSERKCKYLKEVIKIDEVINYKTENLSERLKNTRIDVYFDNVGESVLDIAIRQMRQNGRIALCGAIDNYNNYQKRQGIQNYQMIVTKRILMRGIVFLQLGAKIPEVLEEYVTNINQGKFIIHFEEFNSIEKIPEAIQFCFKGENIGKIVVNISNLTYEEVCQQLQKIPNL